MSEIKSAFEIALEKASRLGSASAQELKAIEEKELAPMGRNLAERYLRGEYRLRDIAIALERQERGRDVMLAAAKSRLVEALAQGDGTKPLEGLLFLARDKARVEATSRQAEALCREHQETKRQRLEAAAKDIEQARRRELEDRGISGSALRIEASATDEWHQLSAAIDASLGQSLEQLRPDLTA